MHDTEYSKNDKKYFPLWVRRYTQMVKDEGGRLPVSEESVKAFSHSLLDSGTPA